MTATTLSAPSVGLRELRQALGLSQEGVARLAGCSTSMIRQLEHGYVPAGSAVLPRVIEALNEEGRSAGNATASETRPGRGDVETAYP